VLSIGDGKGLDAPFALAQAVAAVTYTSALTEVRLFSADDLLACGQISPLLL
jgi:hypothetical protein